MRKWTWAAAILVLAGVLLVARNDRLDRSAGQTHQKIASQEKSAKMLTVQQDVQLTEELCRNQCLTDLRKTALGMKSVTRSEMPGHLSGSLKSNPHLEALAWYATDSAALSTAGIKLQNYPEQVHTEVQKAIQAIHIGNEYRSSSLPTSMGLRAVMGVPGENGHGLVAVIRQDILTKVESESKRNLRLVTYPNPNRKPGMKAADANNLKETKVSGPEENQGKSHYYNNQIVVKFKKAPTEKQLKLIQRELQASSYEKMGYAYVFTSKKMDTKQMIRYFRKHHIEYAEPHYLYNTNESAVVPVERKPAANFRSLAQQQAEGEPNDTLFAQYQWNLPLINAESGWTLSKGSGDVIVAVVDTGADLTHPDLKDRLISGYNAIDTTKKPLDDVGHGSHVAGIIAATVNNSMGIAGLTWNNPIMPVKVLDNSGAGNAYNVAEGVIWATDHGAKVINMSLGNYAESSFLHDAVKYAYNHDVVLVAASGNDNSGDPGYPAAYSEVLAVAATDNNRNKASFSNYGSYIDVAAPGVNIASTYTNNQYASLSGTSMASPHVAALAALIRSVNPKLTNKEVMDIMRNTAADIGDTGKDNYYGYGQIDVYRALEAAASGTSTAATSQEQPLQAPHGNALSRLLQRLFGR
ncbi:S8 family peptidase [Gorillibacterium timonense]|uniref:S8 family peptidase n=1 Tax=Gorillibacterium timonense TaxID=1689269 RepID=UPI000A4566ED|nr:S8 family peptidase [Gorillibacterium timonense]